MARSTSSTLPQAGADPGLTEAATRIIHKLLGPFDGSLALRLWNDVTHYCGKNATPSFTLVLRDISDVLAKQKVNVIGVSSQSTKGIGDRRAFMTFTVEIDNAERLGIVLGLVAKVSGVDSARRR